MSRKDKIRLTEYLSHIVEAVTYIEDYVENLNEEEFLNDKKTQDAVIRNLEIIGEASNNISKYHAEFAAKYPQVPWIFAYEMRNVLAHGYFKVDLEIVWNTIQNQLPQMRRQIEQLIKQT